MKTFERRMAVTGLEVREGADDLTLTGYASTFNEPYDMGWYQESVDADAFKRTLGQKPDVRLLINHDGLPLARTTSGTLSLSTDKRGLIASATLDRNDPDVQALVPKMQRGDLNEMSFGFRVLEDVWENDMTKRTLRSLDLNGGDVSVVTYPANPNTSVALRAGGNALEAIASAMRAMETRSASDAEIRSLLKRMQDAYGEPTSVSEHVTEAVREIAEQVGGEIKEILTSESDEEARRAQAVHELRKRQLALL
jgi:HK97 family phage prohead protease